MVPERPGPRRTSEFTPELTAQIVALQGTGLSSLQIPARTGVSTATMRVALGRFGHARAPQDRTWERRGSARRSGRPLMAVGWRAAVERVVLTLDFLVETPDDIAGEASPRSSNLYKHDVDIASVDTMSTCLEGEAPGALADLQDSVDDDGVTRPVEQGRRSVGHSKDFRPTCDRSSSRWPSLGTSAGALLDVGAARPSPRSFASSRKIGRLVPAAQRRQSRRLGGQGDGDDGARIHGSWPATTSGRSSETPPSDNGSTRASSC